MDPSLSSEIVHSRYRIQEKIGAGAVGQVYKAYDEEAKRVIALKTIPASAQDETIKRFLREAEVTAKLLEHPNFVEIYEFGRDEGKLFIAMELLDGVDLRRFMQSKPSLTLSDKVAMMLEISRAVGIAHRKKVVHRDLAPSNIHIRANGQIKIMDFGLVRLAESDMTRTGTVMGTPSYMSPEQAEGRKVGPSADVFSLGAVFYELLTGKKVFEANSILATLFLILNEDYEPIHEICPDVPNSLVNVIDTALLKDPEERFSDANAMYDALSTLGLHTKAPRGRKRDEPSAARKLIAAITGLKPSPASDKVPELEAKFTSLAGSLKKTSLAVLLRYSADNSKVGALHLRRGPIEKRLYFIGGRLLSTATNSPRETLGQLLIRIGCLTENQLHESLAEQDRSGEPLGRIVVMKGWLDDARLKELLRLKSEESIYDCFLWPDGEFAFEDGQAPDNVYLSESLDITQLIREGERRRRLWARIRERFPSSLTTFALTDPDAVSVDGSLEPEDRRLLELVRKGQNLAEMALEVHGMEFYVASRMLALLERARVTVAEAPEAPSYEEQVRELRNLLRQGLKHFNAGEDDDARRAFEAALTIDPLSKAYLYLQRIKERQGANDSRATVSLEGVPYLAVSMEKLGEMNLTPEEFFVLSRVTGGWSIRAILQICPMGENEAKSIFSKLIEAGVLVLDESVSQPTRS